MTSQVLLPLPVVISAGTHYTRHMFIEVEFKAVFKRTKLPYEDICMCGIVTFTFMLPLINIHLPPKFFWVNKTSLKGKQFP